jgi:hypothetical protein
MSGDIRAGNSVHMSCTSDAVFRMCDETCALPLDRYPDLLTIIDEGYLNFRPVDLARVSGLFKSSNNTRVMDQNGETICMTEAERTERDEWFGIANQFGLLKV